MNKEKVSGRRLYIILWGGAFIILLAMLLVIQFESKAEKIKLQDKVIGRMYKDSDDVKISSKTAFINLLLRYNGSNDHTKSSPAAIKGLRVLLHDNYGFKIRQQPEDFTIGPVPR